MKSIKYIVLCMFFLASSCKQDDMEDLQLQEELSATKYTFEGPNNKRYEAGFGYTPATDQVYRPAFEDVRIKEDYNFSQAAVKASIEVIKTEEDIESYVRKTIKKSGSFLGVIKFSKTVSDLKKIIRTKSNRVNVIARVEYNDFRSSVVNPTGLDYNDRAKDLLDNNDFAGFFRRYGTSFVNKQVFGGEIYYVYSYESKLINEQTKSKYNRMVSGKLQRIFKLPRTYGFSKADEVILSNTKEILKSATNIGGFAPKFVRNVNEFNAEIRRSRNYLNSRKKQAAGLYQELLPYQYPGKNARLIKEFNNQKTCFRRVEEWSILRAEVANVQLTDPMSSFFPDRYQRAISYVENVLANARNCASTPALRTLQSIIDEYGLRARDNFRVKLGGEINPNVWADRGRVYTHGRVYGDGEVLELVNLGNGRVQFNFKPEGDSRYFGPRKGNESVYGGHGNDDRRTYFWLEHLDGDRFLVRNEYRNRYLRPPIYSYFENRINGYGLTTNHYWSVNAGQGEAIVRIVRQ